MLNFFLFVASLTLIVWLLMPFISFAFLYYYKKDAKQRFNDLFKKEDDKWKPA